MDQPLNIVFGAATSSLLLLKTGHHCSTSFVLCAEHALLESCWCCLNSKITCGMPQCRCGFPFVWVGTHKLRRIPSTRQPLDVFSLDELDENVQHEERVYRAKMSHFNLFYLVPITSPFAEHALLESCWCCLNSKITRGMPQCRCGFPFVWVGTHKLRRIPSTRQPLDVFSLDELDETVQHEESVQSKDEPFQPILSSSDHQSFCGACFAWILLVLS